METGTSMSNLKREKLKLVRLSGSEDKETFNLQKSYCWIICLEGIFLNYMNNYKETIDTNSMPRIWRDSSNEDVKLKQCRSNY
jgi:hypothetical protein